MSSEVAVRDDAEILERVITAGDLARLTPVERVTYYKAVCDSVGLNPLTKPFDYIPLNGRLTLYATKTATDQLRSIKGISIDSVERDATDADYATWLVTGHDTAGRVDTEIGSVSIKGLAGEARANAIMKALTKGKRRLTLSLAGLGWLDETEVGSIASAGVAQVDIDTGEITTPVSTREAIAARKAQLTPFASEAPQPVGTGSVEEAGPVPGQVTLGAVIDARAAEGVDGPSSVERAAEAEGMSTRAYVERGHDAAEMVQCESTSDPKLGDVERCRREEGHKGAHRSTNASWP